MTPGPRYDCTHWTSGFSKIHRRPPPEVKDPVKDLVTTVLLPALEDMTKEPPNSQYNYAQHLTYVQPGSPSFPILEECLLGAYNTAFGATSNRRGIGIMGSRGVGKSNLLRIIALLPTYVYPERFLSVYVNYTSVNYTPLDLAIAACKEADIDATDCESMDDIVYTLSLCNRTLLFCADEVHNVYTNDIIWRQLHSLAESQRAQLYVSSSGPILRAVVESDFLRHGTVLKNHFPSLGALCPPSLNGTKVKLRLLGPLRTLKQYKDCLHATGKTMTEKEMTHLHVHTGGCLGSFDGGISSECFNRPLPPAGTPEHYVLRQLVLHELDSRPKFDPFLPMSVTTGTISRWISTFFVNNPTADPVDIHYLQDRAVIAPSHESDDSFALAQPIVFYQMIKALPRVFISIGMADRREPKLQKLCQDLEGIGCDVQLCTYEKERLKMIKDGTTKYMSSRAQRSTCMLICLSKAYVDRLNDDTSGASYEISEAIHRIRLSKENGPPHRVVPLLTETLQPDAFQHPKLKALFTILALSPEDCHEPEAIHGILQRLM
jgi:hypothetical protein